MKADELYSRYQELQTYLGWDANDAQRVQEVAERLEPFLPGLIDDFYSEIERHPLARKVITGGQPQIDRLKRSLTGWLRELLHGPYDRDYVVRRWKVGLRHVEIGLDQVFTNVALGRLRFGLIGALGHCWHEGQAGLIATIQSLDKLLDLDLAKIEDAYQAEHLARGQRNERLAAIGQISGGIAHELRNPLNVIKTSAYYLSNARNVSAEKTAEHLQRIGQHVAAANDAITALSNFAKMPLPTLVPFSVADCIGDVLTIERIPANIQIELDFPPSLPPALGEMSQLRIVFANLVRNARDAMPEGGKLTIRGELAGPTLMVCVSDTGVGIPTDQLSRVMEPLYSTKARGLGLGLSLAKAIVERHHGSLRVESKVGQGSTFMVCLTTPTNENRSEK